RLEAEAARRLAPPDIIALEGETVRIPLTGAAAWRLRDDYTGEVLAAGAAAGEIVLAPMGPGLRHLELEGEGWTGRSLLIVRPRGRADLPTLTGATAIWGVTTALYGIRSGRNMGLGDYRDLADMARLLGEQG